MTTFECPSKDRENDDTEGVNTDMLLTSCLDILSLSASFLHCHLQENSSTAVVSLPSGHYLLCTILHCFNCYANDSLSNKLIKTLKTGSFTKRLFDL